MGEITYLPEIIKTLILEKRTELMKEDKLDRLENKSHIIFMKCMDELEENVENTAMSIEFQLEDYDEEEAEEYQLHLSTCYFSEILLEQILINNRYI
jgi:hypothetical protein